MWVVFEDYCFGYEFEVEFLVDFFCIELVGCFSDFWLVVGELVFVCMDVEEDYVMFKVVCDCVDGFMNDDYGVGFLDYGRGVLGVYCVFDCGFRWFC